ncbi:MULTISPECIES: c-type cytochrome biogenesis protein CcsB [unclassified Corynebacterium]|uniref:c-type cytochrome biogenesis protein CcsB n=1 Tax=unclassified Corynebacterium TaxID=2624378 RepID=UPI002167DEFA|nr:MULTISPECIES: c-type cytochrome biogenesis protein CcsB [unclassified Corynebacterium]MCS4491284.1 c-type cytochrome biogenesis protein CcsB [Corynebacterium sp. ES2715-CONJ3]MCS4531619.1 c-type cytochrome biogenesis protein CcsB [Corynebacterium sp. ES2730-CONJ]
MNINYTLASFSDSAFFSAVGIYILALVLSVIYYMKAQTVVDSQREAKTVAVRSKNSADTFSGMTQAVVWLGIIIHATSVILRGISAGRFPFGNLYEYITEITLFTMIIAAIFLRKKEMRALWPWIITPVVALLLLASSKLYADTAPVVPILQSYWRPIHVGTISIGGSIGMLSGVVSVLYLLRMAQPKGQEHGFLGAIARPLPTARVLDAVAYRTAIITVPLFGLGIILGAIWAEASWGRFWGWDPKETVAFITWILYAAYLHARATAGWRDTKAAWINILALATMIFNLFFINLVVSGLHSYAGIN